VAITRFARAMPAPVPASTAALRRGDRRGAGDARGAEAPAYMMEKAQAAMAAAKMAACDRRSDRRAVPIPQYFRMTSIAN